MDGPPFMEVSKKKLFQKNFRKHLVVTIKSLTFASAFGNDGKQRIRSSLKDLRINKQVVQAGAPYI